MSVSQQYTINIFSKVYTYNKANNIEADSTTTNRQDKPKDETYTATDARRQNVTEGGEEKAQGKENTRVREVREENTRSARPAKMGISGGIACVGIEGKQGGRGAVPAARNS
jgi:hypothetical protein